MVVIILHPVVIIENAFQTVWHVQDTELRELVHDELKYLDDGVHLLGHVVELLLQVLVLVVQHVNVLHGWVLLLHELGPVILYWCPLIAVHTGS